MSEARLPTYIVAFDEGDSYIPLAAALTHERAERLRQEIIDHLVSEARRRWKIAFDDDPESVRPFDEDEVLREATERVIHTDWNVPFVQSEEAIDPHVLRLATDAAESFGDDAIFLP